MKYNNINELNISIGSFQNVNHGDHLGSLQEFFEKDYNS